MPSIVDMVEILQRLESKSLHIEPGRCAKVRNRNSSCGKCADVCPSGAISIASNVIDIDGEKCMGCGSCSTACPSQAIEMTKPADEELFAKADAACTATDGTAVFVCARVVAHKVADGEKCIEVPCMCRLHVGALVKMAAWGVDEILLLDGNCKTCKYRKTDALTNKTVAEFEALMNAWGKDVSARRISQVPEWLKAETVQQSVGGVSRRDFFGGARESARNVAKETVSYAIEKEIAPKPKLTLRDVLKVDDNGNMPRHDVQRHEELLEDLYSLGEPAQDCQLQTTQWGNVHFDAEKCMRCGVCSTFCTTGALSKIIEEVPVRNRKPKKEVVGLEYRLSDCIGCGLCQDSCMHGAIEIDHCVPASMVFELEPVELRGNAQSRKFGAGSVLGRR